MNYNWEQWDATRANYSGVVPMVISEMSRGNSARGVYDDLRAQGSGYYSVYSAAPAFVNSWHQINSRRPWLAGGFLWTGFDYVGEPRNPVSVSSSFGALDLCGFEKGTKAHLCCAHLCCARPRVDGTDVCVRPQMRSTTFSRTGPQPPKCTWCLRIGTLKR
jgi:hypothetical protein